MKTITSKVISWAFWDLGTSAHSAIVTTFVFAPYLRSESFGKDADEWIGVALGVAGLLIALWAPLSGQQAHHNNSKMLWLRIMTILLGVSTVCLFFVSPGRLGLGLFLLALGSLAAEIGQVHYNAMLQDITDRSNYGKVSAYGWALGYFGTIGALVILLALFITPETAVFGITNLDMKIRAGMVFTGMWVLLFSIPALLIDTKNVGVNNVVTQAPSRGLIESYKRLFQTIKDIWKTNRSMIMYLISSALFRDGVAGVFAFGGILAVGSFGFTEESVIIFAVVSNLVAALVTFISGNLTKRYSSRFVIIISLSICMAAGIGLVLMNSFGQVAFWFWGLLLSACVGPAQSAARTYLADITPEHLHGEAFGLYATTGRAVSFLAPFMWTIALLLGRELAGEDSQYFGVLGIISVILVGLLMFIFTSKPTDGQVLFEGHNQNVE